jgi:hypothetical protein
MKKKVVSEYQPKLKVLEVNFADMKIGQKMAIGTPEMILELTKMIPKGERWTMKDLRIALAKKLKADVACPVTTSMFFRIAIEDVVANGITKRTPPFWRVVEINSPFFKKLSPKSQKAVISRLSE